LSTFVEQRTGVPGLAALQGMDDAPGDGAGRGAAVAAQPPLIAHAAERHARELRPALPAMLWPSDVLPTPGVPTKQRIEPFASGFMSAPRDTRESVLDRLESVVVAVEDFARRLEVEPVPV